MNKHKQYFTVKSVVALYTQAICQLTIMRWITSVRFVHGWAAKGHMKGKIILCHQWVLPYKMKNHSLGLR